MGLSRERKIVVGVLSLAVGALLFDKAFLSPSPASGAAPEPRADPPSRSAARAQETGRAAQSDTTPTAGGMLAGAGSDIARRLREAATARMLDSAGVGDAFSLPEGWEMIVAPETESVPEPAPTEVRTDLRVSSTMPSAGIAVINGRTVRLGQTIDGHRLERVDGHSAVLKTPSGAELVLRTRDPAR